MNDIKTMLQSRTVWAAIIGFLVVIADATGLDLGAEQGEIINAVMKAVEAVSFIAAMVFRIHATARIA
jgi:uncharacterized membrane protein (DUF441 family)